MPDTNVQTGVATQDVQTQEKFESGVSDTDLVELINKWERESDDLYSILKFIWLQNINYYNGLQTDVEKVRGAQSKAVENRIFMSIETMVPIATARLPEVVVKPLQDDEQAQLEAGETQDVLAYQFERLSFQEQAERWVRDMLIKRLGVFKVGWDKPTDDVSLTTVDPKRIRIPKFGKTVKALPWLIEELELSYETCVKIFGVEKANKIVELSPGELDSEGNKVRKASFIVKQVWTNTYLAYKVGNTIIKQEKNPYYKFDEKSKNFFTDPSKPYVIKGLFETDESLMGDTDYIQQVKFLQDNLNNRRRQTENIINRTANPNLLIDSDVMSEEEAQSITNEPGQIIYGKDAANGQKIRFESPGTVSPALFSDMNDTRQAIDNIMGTHSTTRGEREGRETLGGRQMLREADLGRIDLIGRQLERAIDEIAEWFLQLMKLYYTEDKEFTLLGEDGFQFVKSFNGSKIGKVKPMVKVGSTLKEDDSSIKQFALLLFQNKAIGIKQLYKMIRMPNMQDAIDDWVKTQTGEYLKPAGGGGTFVPPEQMAGQQPGAGVGAPLV